MVGSGRAELAAAVGASSVVVGLILSSPRSPNARPGPMTTGRSPGPAAAAANCAAHSASSSPTAASARWSGRSPTPAASTSRTRSAPPNCQSSTRSGSSAARTRWRWPRQTSCSGARPTHAKTPRPAWNGWPRNGGVNRGTDPHAAAPEAGRRGVIPPATRQILRFGDPALS